MTPGTDQKEAKTSAPTLDDLPPTVRRRVREADAAVAALHRAATDELKARRPGRSVRHQFRKAEGGDRNRP